MVERGRTQIAIYNAAQKTCGFYFDVFLTVHHSIDLFQLPTYCTILYSVTIRMLHYDPRHVSSITCPSSGGQIVLSQHLVSSLSVNGCTVCRMLSSGILYSRLWRVTIPDTVIIQFVLLKMGM